MALPMDDGKAARELLMKLAADYLKSHPKATRSDIGQYLANRISQEDKTADARLAGEQLMAICLNNVIGGLVDEVFSRAEEPRHG